jgi:large subunit ribosomal protein L35
MPKMKTRKAAAKRFMVTGSGKIMRYRARHKHLLEHKAKTTKNKLGKKVEVSPSDRKYIRLMIGGI